MNDTEFLELLNLYLDHEISTADAVRLEAEVQHNPKRRAVYREYCRMEKACQLLVEDFQATRARPEATAGCEKIVAFAPPSRGVGLYVASAVAIAAAGVALVFLGLGGRQSREVLPGGSSPAIVQQATRSSEAPGVSQAAGAVSSAPRSLVRVDGMQGEKARTYGTLVSDSLVLSGRKQAEVMRAAAEQAADDQLSWMRNFQLVSLHERKQIDSLHFEAAPATLRPEGRHLGGQYPAEATVEMTAFRFVK